MPLYRLVFPPSPDEGPEHSPTADVDSGDVVYKPGDIVEVHGKKWQVSEAPNETPELGARLDLMVWPAG
jgi:hypothetical protein